MKTYTVYLVVPTVGGYQDKKALISFTNHGSAVEYLKNLLKNFPKNHYIITES
jgi:hypothetical protein